MTKVNGWIVYDPKGKPLLNTLHDYEATSKVCAEIHFNKSFSILAGRGFTCKKTRLYLIDR